MTATIHEQDSFSLNVDVVKQPEGVVLPLAGALVEGFARGCDGLAIEATCEVTSAPLGKIRVFFPPGTFERGAYELQVRVDLAGEVQTVLSGYTINVMPSFGD